MDEATYAKIFPLEYLRKFLAAECREDGRDLLSARKTVIEVNNLPTANGSSIVKLGDTVVVCGIKLEVGLPALDKPRDGSIVVKLSLPTSAGAHVVQVTNRAANELNVQAFSQQLQECVLECDLIDLSQLCIIENTAAWVIYADVVVVNDDGNVFDAALLALNHALKNTLLPHTFSPDEKTVYTTDGEPTPLQLNRLLAPTSFALIDEYLIADPALKEAQFSQASITVILDQDGVVCGLHKPGGKPISDAVLGKALQGAARRAGQLKHKQQSPYPIEL